MEVVSRNPLQLQWVSGELFWIWGHRVPLKRESGWMRGRSDLLYITSLPPPYTDAFPLTDEALDTLLDQEGLEVDPIDRLEADTPLHKAVRFVNGLSSDEWEGGASLVELLIDAGADPRSFPLHSIPPFSFLFLSGDTPSNALLTNKSR